MPTNFPTSVDVLVNPTPTDSLNAPAHSTQHANANDAIEAIEGYLLTSPFGLRLVKTQTIGTTVSSVTVTDAFSATYESYKILVTGGASSASVDSTTFKLGASATGYYFGAGGATFAGGALVTSNNNTTAWNFIWRANTSNISLDFELTNPFLAKPTLLKASSVGSDRGFAGHGVHGVSTSYTDFTMALTGATLTGGTIYVYGYTK
jgi:hypothetical protein